MLIWKFEWDEEWHCDNCGKTFEVDIPDDEEEEEDFFDMESPIQLDRI